MTGPITAFHLAATQIFMFSGRATRSEFWWVALLAILICTGALVSDILRVGALLADGGLDALLLLGPLDFRIVIAATVTAVFTAALAVRRLHDAGHSGLWLLATFVPVVGSMLLMVMWALPSTQGASVYGAAADGKPALPRKAKAAQKAEDPHERAMRGYAYLFNSEVKVTPEMEAARKAEIEDYYRTRVLKPAPTV